MRVVRAIAVSVLRARHEEVTAACAGDRLHADLERDRVDVGVSAVTKDDGATDGPAETAEPPARTDEALEVLEVVVLVEESEAPTERDIGRSVLLQRTGIPRFSDSLTLLGRLNNWFAASRRPLVNELFFGPK